MKKILVTMMVAIASATVALAQHTDQESRQRPTKSEMAQHATERTVKQLGLNEQQAKQLLELNTAYADKLFAMRPGGRRPHRQLPDSSQQQRPSREQMEARQKAMKADRDAYDGELKKILTDEQYAQYEKAQKQRLERGPRRDGGGRRAE